MNIFDQTCANGSKMILINRQTRIYFQYQKMDYDQSIQQKMQEKFKQFLKLAQEKRVAKLSDGHNKQSLSPFTMVLQPFKITNKQFQRLKKYSRLWQKITYLASQDSQLILESLENLKNDRMVEPMLKIYKDMIERTHQAQKQGKKCNILHKPRIQLFRTDFFITEEAKNNVKLIQYNNMSVSMAGVSQQFEACLKIFWGKEKNILDNKCTETYGKGIANFCNKKGFSDVFLAVVQQNQTNVVDQNLLFQQILKHSKIKIKKIFLQELDKETEIDENGDLKFHGEKVDIVYYRAGYSSSQKINWAGVGKCNLSNAINIPAVNSFLIGTKKMQAVLSKKEVMIKFLTQQQSDFLFQSVIDTWDFEGQKSKHQAIKMIQVQGAEHFILKPNQQGGKHNLFGEDAYKKVKELSPPELMNYILTKKVYSRKQNCSLIRSDQWENPIVQNCQIQSQVSIYGCICSGLKCNCQQKGHCQCSDECMQNCCEGYLVRSKPVGVNQGGLMAGTGAICGLQLVQQVTPK